MQLILTTVGTPAGKVCQLRRIQVYRAEPQLHVPGGRFHPCRQFSFQTSPIQVCAFSLQASLQTTCCTGSVSGGLAHARSVCVCVRDIVVAM
jgi:hypothetical protein